MARPTRQGLDYFPLDTHYDRKLQMYLADTGAPGLGVLVALWQLIYREEGYYVQDGEELHLWIKREVSIDTDFIQACITSCLRWEIFHAPLHAQFGILTSRGIQKRFFAAASRKKEVSCVQEFLLIPLSAYKNLVLVSMSGVIVDNNTTTNGINVDNNPAQRTTNGINVDNNPAQHTKNGVTVDNNATNVNVNVNVKEKVKVKEDDVGLLDKPKRQPATRQVDGEFLETLSQNSAYLDLDIHKELGKCEAWCLVNRIPTPPSKKRFVNWLNRSYGKPGLGAPASRDDALLARTKERYQRIVGGLTDD